MLGTGSFRVGGSMALGGNMSPMGSVGLGTTIYEPQAQVLTMESLQLQIRQMYVALTEERQQRLMLQGQLLACQRRLDKLDPPDTPLRAAVRMVENRGNIRVSHATGQVSLLRRLDFQPRTTKEEPSAVFRDPDVAEAICKDLAEISSIFNCPMTIEGHTKGGESEFWQTLANRRARIVAELMIDFGAEPSLLHTCGLPGRHGKNAVDTEVHMDIKNIKDELIPLPETTEVDVIVNGRVVERDFIQAGRVVKRDTIAAPVLERDVVDSSGRVIERDFFVRPPETDSIGFSGSGRAVERQITPTQTIFSSERQITPTRRPLTPRTVVLRPSIMS